MPSESDKRIEPVLRAYARSRRQTAGAPLELHPAMRQLLQGEVRRTFGDRGAVEPGRGAWLFWWPRLAWAGGICAALALVLAAILRSPGSQPPKMALAENRPAPAETKQLAQLPPPPAPAEKPAAGRELLLRGPAETNLRADRAASPDAQALASASPTKDLKSAPARNRAVERLAAAPSAPPPPSPRGSVEQERLMELKVTSEPPVNGPTATEPARAPAVAAGELPGAKGIAAATPSPGVQFTSRGIVLPEPAAAPAPIAASAAPPAPLAAPAPTTAMLARRSAPSNPVPRTNTLMDNLAAGTRLQFVAVAPTAKAEVEKKLRTLAESSSAPANTQPAALLSSFAFERSGDQVRIIDRDNSVYQGTLITLATGSPTNQSSMVLAEGNVVQNAATSFGRAYNGLQAAQDKNALESNVERITESGVSRGSLGSSAPVTQETYFFGVQPVPGLGGAPGAPVLYFRASGTNRTLSRTVELRGVLITVPAAAPQAAGAVLPQTSRFRAAGGRVSTPQAAASGPGLSLRGQAVVGGTNQITIDAVAAPSSPRP